MELRYLRSFVYVADTLSFSISATRCCPFLQLIVPTGFCCCCFGCRDYSQDYTIMKEKKVKVTHEAMAEPSTDDLKENKKERKLEQVSFFLPDSGQATALLVIPHFRGACPHR